MTFTRKNSSAKQCYLGADPGSEPIRAAMPVESLARRQMLLKSLGKGSAVIAAASVPMHSLAAFGTLAVTATGQRCTLSGVMSGVHSRETVADVCGGMRPNFYMKVPHWPNYNSLTNPNGTSAITGGSGSFNKDSLFSQVFGSGPNVGLLAILNAASTYPVEVHWVTALLNGTSGSSAINYPYYAQQIIDLYAADAGAGTMGAGYKFLTGYLETL